MASEFASLLARFVEVYRACPDGLKRALASDEFGAEYLDSKKKGDRIAEEEISSRALLELQKAQIAELLDGFEPIAPDELSDNFYNEAFGKLDLEKLAASSGVSKDDVIPYLVTQIKIFQEQEAERPDYHCVFALDFAARIDKIVERFSYLDDLKIDPDNRTLLKEAHLCYLYGLDAPSAITCGAALEETLKSVLPKSDKKFEDLLIEARDCSLLSEEEWGMGDDVREFRNLAAHAPTEFLRRSRVQKINLLDDTKRLIEILLRNKEEARKN